MSPDLSHEEIEDMLAAYVLDALEPEDRESVRAHLEGCATCTATVRRLERARDAMPLAVDVVEPPPRLRESILAAASGEGNAARPKAARPKAALPSKVLPLPRPAGPRPRFAPPRGLTAGIAAAAVIAFALGAGLGLGVGRSLTPNPPASSVAQYRLTGSGTMSGATGQVYELENQGLTLVEFRNLPALQAEKVYELWLIPGQGNPIPAGVFMPDQGGGHVVVLARNLQGVSALAVTVEAGPDGAPAPTQQPELVGNV
jgi:anti-sigma-K factor RskA